MFDGHDPPADNGNLFDLLASQRRRLLLRSLFNHGGTADLRDLSREVIAHETNSPPEDVDSDELARVYVSLYLEHIPVLEGHGIITCDAAGYVEYVGDRTDEVLAILRDPGKYRRRRAVYYIGIAVILWGIVLLRVSQVVPVSESVVAVFTVAAAAALLVLATTHYYGTQLRRFSKYLLDLPRP